MLRITFSENAHVRLLRLEGQLAGPWVAELENACTAPVANGHQLVLDLAGLSFADHEGARLLARLVADRASLSGCSAFLREQIRQHDEQPDGG
ncbi:MAG TPA: hypothetical protein DCY13_14620 [Verrucomicrobiales bacterium]|nr:hypothetical protein [Verrucomicrobiales bacterium]